ncbi:hypothetical protein [Coxiella endosymbiont of Ornithodoros maritimus]|uniref:hypothetical protein n=1 Tax=Coxiella endosymbiont of Ornithodoros maritimus TaxID=1656172 RepID=UPI002B3FFCE2|nr:hypothetical protein [Coxiella endosymbiont of Ornithodoros maritimus]
MNLFSTVLEGLGGELKLILASDNLKPLILHWIKTQETEILAYLPKCRSQNGSEALRFCHSLSEEKLSENSPEKSTTDLSMWANFENPTKIHYSYKHQTRQEHE